MSRNCLLQGWEFLQKEELDQDNGPGQKVGLPGQEIMFLADIEVRLCFYENYSDELSDSVGVAINGKTGI